MNLQSSSIRFGWQNEIDHTSKILATNANAISLTLSKVKDFAQRKRYSSESNRKEKKMN